MPGPSKLVVVVVESCVKISVSEDGEAGDDWVVESGAQGLRSVDLPSSLVLELPACDDVSGDEDDGGDEHQHRDHQGHHKQTHCWFTPNPIHANRRHTSPQRFV